MKSRIFDFFLLVAVFLSLGYALAVGALQ